jgi:glutamate synthase (ferredoxin)
MKVKEQGLYLPEFEHDNCGAGFICNLNGIKSNDIIHKALDILIKLESWCSEADGNWRWSRDSFLTFLMIFFKKYVTSLFRNERICSENGFLTKKKKTS